MFGRRKKQRWDGYEWLLAEGMTYGCWPHEGETPAEYADRLSFNQDVRLAAYRMEAKRRAALQ